MPFSLLFYPAPRAALPRLLREGLRAPDASALHLFTTLEAAEAAGGCTLVIDAEALPHRPRPDTEGGVVLDAVPPEAVVNLDPYRPPVPVAAAGGYVMRRTDEGPEVLLIFRRGVWDLPKGKLDPGETIEECALREVREELGIEALTLVTSLGTTRHGYPDGDAYAVKTTHWYLMQTPERSFTPETEEDIEAVEWVPWGEALERVGYDSLRVHMQHIDAQVVAWHTRPD